MAGFQVSINGRFWVSTEVMERRELEDAASDDEDVVDGVADFLELAGRAYLLYEKALPLERRELIEIVTSNRVVEGRTPRFTLSPPFAEFAADVNQQSGGPSRERVRTGSTMKRQTSRRYEIAPEAVTLADGYPVRVWAKAGTAGAGRGPRLLVVPVARAEAEGDLLEQPVDLTVFPGAPPAHAAKATWVDWLTDGVFGADDPPRFAILAGADDWLLLDSLKWPNNRLLRFTWPEILDGRQER